MKRLLPIAFLFFLYIPTADAATFYVCPDTQGEYGLEDGTSLANCYDGNADISWASINPGDTLQLCGDWSPSDARITVTDSGTAGNFITLDGSAGACGRGKNSTISRAGITGTNGRAIAASNTGANRAYIRIQNLDVSDCSDYCILWERSTTGSSTDDTTLEIDNMNFDRCGSTAAPGQACIRKKGAGLKVTNSTFDYCYEDCIWTLGKDVEVRNNTFSNISYGTEETIDDFGLLIGGDALQVNASISGDSITDSGYSRFTNNYCDHTNMDVKYCALIQATGTAPEITVTDNTALCPATPENLTASRQCHPIYIDADPDSVIKVNRNFTQGGETGIAVTSLTSAPFATRAQIIGNIVTLASDRGIWTDAFVDNIDILHNNVSGSVQEGIYVGAGNSNVRLANNILFNNSTGVYIIGSIGYRGQNSYWRNGTTSSLSGVAGPALSNEHSVNPQFIGGENPSTMNDYRLVGTTTLTAGGVNFGDYKDFAGRPFEHFPTIGALQHTWRDFVIYRPRRNTTGV